MLAEILVVATRTFGVKSRILNCRWLQRVMSSE